MKYRMGSDRRAALKALGGLGAALLLDRGSWGRAETRATTRAGGGTACLLDPDMTEGPFWVDEKLNRSDITADTHRKASPIKRPGLALALCFTVHAYDAGACTPLPGAQVDIWHADASGVYSDADNFGGADAAGQDSLRGYQVTDANGQVRFTTIYPGWYAGRAVHIHLKVRLFDRSRRVTTETTTQAFFDEGISDAVYRSHPAYRGRPGRPTRNGDDDIYDNHDEMLLGLKGDPVTGYQGALALGVKVATVSRAEHGPHRPPPRPVITRGLHSR